MHWGCVACELARTFNEQRAGFANTWRNKNVRRENYLEDLLVLAKEVDSE